MGLVNFRKLRGQGRIRDCDTNQTAGRKCLAYRRKKCGRLFFIPTGAINKICFGVWKKIKLRKKFQHAEGINQVGFFMTDLTWKNLGDDLKRGSENGLGNAYD